MQIIVLGTGRQGKIIAQDLIESGYDVLVSDVSNPNIKYAKFIQVDLSNPYKKLDVIKQADLVVCALPSRLGYETIKTCIMAEKNCVDLSYCEENVLDLDADAKQKRVKILPDCGVAPGLSNLIAGRAIHTQSPKKVSVQVGGFAKDSNVPLGYSLTWSPEDLLEEFLRPARIIKDGHVEEREVLSGIETFEVDGIGKLEAFYTDGLRTMLSNYGSVQTLEEKTIRRAGHMSETKRLVEEGKFIEFIQKCSNIEDVLVMRVIADGKEEVLIVKPEDGVSAMARATAFSCSVFAQILADDFVDGWGIIPPEILAQDDDCYTHILDKLAVKNIMFGTGNLTHYPFLRANG